MTWNWKDIDPLAYAAGRAARDKTEEDGNPRHSPFMGSGPTAAWEQGWADRDKELAEGDAA
jgi:hypothetical protein